jgi:hypothetical protein
MTGGRLVTPLGTADAPLAEGARITGVDLSGRLTLSEALSRPEDVAGRFVIVRGSTGRDSRWRVVSIAADGRSLQLDLDRSGTITMRGRVENVENDRQFATGLRLPERPAPGTPIRIGPVGDFTTRRHLLEHAQQTGLPIRVGGTTTAVQPRLYYLGLDVRARLSPADVGKDFWSSGIETGDDLFTEPFAVVTLGE